VSPLLVIGIPLALTIIGIVLNSFHIVHDQPQYSLDEDEANKLAAERQANDRFFHLQRARILQRQKRIGRYGWLVLAVFIASSWWLYSDAVRSTAVSKQISAIQTLAVADSKDTVLSLTLSDGSHVQYVVKAPGARTGNASKKVEQPQESVQKWELASLGTALNIGDARLPLGIALKMSN
jgi:hypothetical protein